MADKTTIFSFLSSTSPVRLVANDTLPSKPLITELKDDAGNSKVDLMDKPLGSIRLGQERRALNGSFMNTRGRTAFITAPMVDLQKIIKDNKLAEGSVIGGTIVIIESLEPMWKGQQPKINPALDPSDPSYNIGITMNGQFYPVYMKMEYRPNETDPDRLMRTPEDVHGWLISQQALAGMLGQGTAETAAIPGTGAKAIPAQPKAPAKLGDIPTG